MSANYFHHPCNENISKHTETNKKLISLQALEMLIKSKEINKYENT